jgi:hypothetical protein
VLPPALSKTLEVIEVALAVSGLVLGAYAVKFWIDSRRAARGENPGWWP